MVSVYYWVIKIIGWIAKTKKMKPKKNLSTTITNKSINVKTNNEKNP